ncbi:hypothetical protein AZF37_05360 [endosymbiont 'TC1' of Trimyema compressum]|uniref:TetR/AcrR family transcriptional regulator n=1 Tax=endosymbiont 'TC1' of Trimyema compressum TaxID=243899 RepID=UPI0007F08FD0|nr:TetR/AcrR family transcriptional regulator [endosymbiont 'TC1' of Trimyema compressum]AMP20681.1 hypothetical protein AZF37_05360 [endosymbiont 'TC1' of Trimyema compressum]
MNKYELTTKKKKAAIIYTAQTLFKNEGVSDVNMKKIADKAGVSQASIYNYFGSKETLVSECAKAVMKDTLIQANEILHLEISYLDKINKVLAICNDGLNHSISEYFSEKALQDKQLVKLLVKNFSESKNMIYRQYIELGKQENCIDTTIPTETYLRFIGALGTIADTSTDSNEKLNLEHLHKLFLYGLLGAPC